MVRVMQKQLFETSAYCTRHKQYLRGSSSNKSTLCNLTAIPAGNCVTEGMHAQENINEQSK